MSTKLVGVDFNTYFNIEYKFLKNSHFNWFFQPYNGLVFLIKDRVFEAMVYSIYDKNIKSILQLNWTIYLHTNCFLLHDENM